jgi:hypothetical protein
MNTITMTLIAAEAERSHRPLYYFGYGAISFVIVSPEKNP